MSDLHKIACNAVTKVTEVAYPQTKRFGARERASAGFLLSGPDNALILQRRDMFAPAAPGMLALFGGRAEPGETMLEAALREIQEELGLMPEVGDIQVIGTVMLEQPERDGISTRFFYRLKEMPKQCFEGAIECHSLESAIKDPLLTLCANGRSSELQPLAS